MPAQLTEISRLNLQSTERSIAIPCRLPLQEVNAQSVTANVIPALFSFQFALLNNSNKPRVATAIIML